jgi:hypothetical protein
VGLDASDVVFGVVDDKVIDAGRNPAAVWPTWFKSKQPH